MPRLTEWDEWLPDRFGVATSTRPGTSRASEHGPITRFKILVQHLGDLQWLAVAYPATDDLILNDVPNPDTTVFTCAAHLPEAQFSAWSDQWYPDAFTRFNPGHDPLPACWSAGLAEIVDTARRRRL